MDEAVVFPSIHNHVPYRAGFGTGTSDSTMVWGPWRCWCGMVFNDLPTLGRPSDG